MNIGEFGKSRLALSGAALALILSACGSGDRHRNNLQESKQHLLDAATSVAKRIAEDANDPDTHCVTVDGTRISNFAAVNNPDVSTSRLPNIDLAYNNVERAVILTTGHRAAKPQISSTELADSGNITVSFDVGTAPNSLDLKLQQGGQFTPDDALRLIDQPGAHMRSVSVSHQATNTGVSAVFYPNGSVSYLKEKDQQDAAWETVNSSDNSELDALAGDITSTMNGLDHLAGGK